MCSPKTIVTAAVAVLLSISSYAQGPYLGVFNSLKGIGAALELPAKDPSEFNSFALYAEIFGIPTGRCSEPGVKFNWSHNFILWNTEKDSTVYSIYAGPGISCGYMRDFELGKRKDKSLVLTKKPGVMTALSGTGGARFSFSGRIALDLSFTLDLGIFVRRDEALNNFDLNLYRNGLAQSLYPQLSILVLL